MYFANYFQMILGCGKYELRGLSDCLTETKSAEKKRKRHSEYENCVFLKCVNYYYSLLIYYARF